CRRGVDRGHAAGDMTPRTSRPTERAGNRRPVWCFARCARASGDGAPGGDGRYHEGRTGRITTFALAVLAGAFIAVGAAFATNTLAGTSAMPYGVARLLAGLAFV